MQLYAWICDSQQRGTVSIGSLKRNQTERRAKVYIACCGITRHRVTFNSKSIALMYQLKVNEYNFLVFL